MSTKEPTSARGIRFWPLLKGILLVVALVFITRRAMELWKSAPPESVSVNWIWFVPAGVCYFVGWLPSVWLWRAFLRSMGRSIDWWSASRAYYVGHLGKYVPGKALALVIRGALVEDKGVSPVLAGVTGGCETLVYMASGAAWAIALTPIALGKTASLPLASWCHEHPGLWILVVAITTIATTPVSAWFFTRLCRKASSPLTTQNPAVITPGLVLAGVGVTSIGWWFHALSLGFVLQSISAEPINALQFPMWLAASALSLVGGFIVLVAPGGIGVREGLLIEALKDQPTIGPAHAIIVAGLLRAVWFVTELIAAGALFVRGSGTKQFKATISDSPESPGS